MNIKKNKNFNTIIIGAGIIGLCIAYYLAKRDVKVAIIEKNFINCGTSGASECNLLVGSNSPGVIDDLGFKSLEEYENLKNVLTMDFEYIKWGSLLLIENEKQKAFAMELIKKRSKSGVKLEYLENKFVRKNIIPISKKLFGAVFCKDDASINSLKLNNSLRNEISVLDSKLFFHEEVKGINKIKNSLFEILTDKGNYFTENLVNSAGCSSPVIAQMLGEEIPVFPSKGQVMVTEKNKIKPQISMRDINDIYEDSSDDKENVNNHYGIKFVMQPTFSQNILIGKSEELGNYQNTISIDILKMIAKRAVDFLPMLGDINIIRTYAGFRPHCVDGIPIIGESNKHSNFYYATGHGGGGITLGPVTGKIISQLIINGKTDYDIKDYSPSRFLERS